MRAISEPARTVVAAFVAISGPANVPLLGTHNTGSTRPSWGSLAACPAGSECDAEHPAVTAAP